MGAANQQREERLAAPIAVTDLRFIALLGCQLWLLHLCRVSIFHHGRAPNSMTYFAATFRDCSFSSSLNILSKSLRERAARSFAFATTPPGDLIRNNSSKGLSR